MFKYGNFINKNKQYGFSLLEIVVALALLSIALVAIISVATKVLQVEHVTENDFVAKGLLSEGLALAEAKRNANVTALAPFYSSLTQAVPVDGTVYTMRIDYSADYTQIGSGGNGAVGDPLARLKYDSVYFYQYATGTSDKFYRMLKTTYHKQGSKDWLEVECQVYWADHGKGSTQKLTTVLYNTAY